MVSRQGTDARFLGLGWRAVHREEKEKNTTVHREEKQSAPVVPEIVSTAEENGDHAVTRSPHTAGDPGVTITSLTTSHTEPDLLSAFEAMWT